MNVAFKRPTAEGEDAEPDVVPDSTLTGAIHGKYTEKQAVRSRYLVEDFDEILVKICKKIKKSGIDLSRAFKLFDRDEDGELTFNEFKETMNFCNIELTDTELEIIFTFSDADGNQLLSYQEFTGSVIYAKEVQIAFDPSKWMLASRDVTRAGLLNSINENRHMIMQRLKMQHGEY